MARPGGHFTLRSAIHGRHGLHRRNRPRSDGRKTARRRAETRHRVFGARAAAAGSDWTDWSVTKTVTTYSLEISVGTFNLLGATYTFKGPWDVRKGPAGRLILNDAFFPDILGTQETANEQQMNDMIAMLREHYDYRAGEHETMSAHLVFWKRERFELVEAEDVDMMGDNYPRQIPHFALCQLRAAAREGHGQRNPRLRHPPACGQRRRDAETPRDDGQGARHGGAAQGPRDESSGHHHGRYEQLPHDDDRRCGGHPTDPHEQRVPRHLRHDRKPDQRRLQHPLFAGERRRRRVPDRRQERHEAYRLHLRISL